MNNSKNIKSLAIWAILASCVLIPFFIFEEGINTWIRDLLSQNQGNTPAIALILFAILASDIFLPIPSCLLSAMCGTFLGPILGFAVSFAAMSISSLVGYLVGRTASPLALKIIGKNESSLKDTAKSGPFMLFILRPVPVLAECSCVYAGLKRYDFAKSALWVSIANAVVSAVYAIIGHLGRANDSFMPAFAAVIILSGVGFLYGKLFHKEKLTPEDEH